MDRKHMKNGTAGDVEAVVTSFNQGHMLLEAVQSICCQTTPPAGIIVVDDGSTDQDSIKILDEIQGGVGISVPVTVLRQPNRGVSAARNAGISRAKTPIVLVLDGDDSLEPSYIEQTGSLLREHPTMAAASSWLHTFGVLDAVVCPPGGGITAFLARNGCPAANMFRRSAWKQCGGYDESMRSGFEDWDFFLSMLETLPDAYIGIVEKPLINYRTAPASSNIKSMSKRLDLMRFIIEKHIHTYRKYIVEAVLGTESISMERLDGWEKEILHTMTAEQELSRESEEFLSHPSYGDGGMAAAVRIGYYSRDRNAH